MHISLYILHARFLNSTRVTGSSQHTQSYAVYTSAACKRFWHTSIAALISYLQTLLPLWFCLLLIFQPSIQACLDSPSSRSSSCAVHLVSAYDATGVRAYTWIIADLCSITLSPETSTRPSGSFGLFRFNLYVLCDCILPALCIGKWRSLCGRSNSIYC